jgi:hypothetical protein
MPFSMQADETLGLLAVVATGLITGTDLLQLHAELAAETGRREKCLIDFSSADVSQLSGPLVRDLAGLPPRFSRLALVAKPGLAYGLARMYQASADSHRAVGVFMNSETAMTWLTKGPAGTQKPT